MERTIGSTIRKIRTDKNYSQRYVTDGIMTQSAYSKFELNKTDISFFSLAKILENLEVSMDEFLYIHNGFCPSAKNRIISAFTSISYNDEEQLNELVCWADAYLDSEDDLLVRDIQALFEGLLLFVHTSNEESLKASVTNVWERLSGKNQLYLTDLYLLNAIFYLFPLETMLEVRKLAEYSLARYSQFPKAPRLHLNFSVNISLLLMKENRFAEALEEAEAAIPLAKQHKAFLQLAVCYVRKGICLQVMKEGGQCWIDKGMTILEVLDEEGLLRMADGEVARYTVRL
ncbi:helix-turn-helix domain-containing protein [Sporosarcina koreensis]|uniref:helix-turn-helix domain-containing protein n=1 Tax=Sporosarcina koreensis TaxID=334735 RepID=UPI00058C0772|nr:helix-turn-helix transcriptional regulator [Sporosarcina koreensis]